MIKSYNYHNVIKLPTRITHTSATCIDHLYTNNKKSILEKFLLIDNISDHLPIFAILNIKNSQKRYEPIYFRNFKKLNNDLFLEESSNLIQSLHTKFTQNPNSDIDTEFQTLNDTLKTLINKNIPLQKLSRKATKLRQKPWLSKDILKSSREKIDSTSN